MGNQMSAEQIKNMMSALYLAHPDVKPALTGVNPYQILVATVLSAQCTDVRVNQVTPAVFAKYPDPAALALSDEEELSILIKPCGLFRSKAKHLIEAAKIIVGQFGGEVPNTPEALRKLPGVGQKTANVVFANAFGGQAIAVDTHVFRVANRTGLAVGNSPAAVEKGLREIIPMPDWSLAHHTLLWHGRRICGARRPLCGECPVGGCCPRNGI